LKEEFIMEKRKLLIFPKEWLFVDSDLELGVAAIADGRYKCN